jgi:hypothetical protein
MTVFASAVLAATAGGIAPVAASAPVPSATLKPDELLAKVREIFRSHRPPPPYVTYTLVREQQTEVGYPDYVNSYTYHIWTRNSDRASLGRKVFRDDNYGPLEFMRPAFNEDRDPGPPTADVFEKAPLHPHPVEFVPTPEPAAPIPVIGEVRAVGETQYKVLRVLHEGNLLHLSVSPIRDPDRNRLREIFVDAKTLELKKLEATDKLFVPGDKVYPVMFTVYMSTVDGYPVVSSIHGVVLGEYQGDGETIDYHFNDITFPKALPDWYFDAHTYASHSQEAPE